MTRSLKANGDGVRPVATLWRLTWKGDLLSCSVYRDGEGLELRLESPAAVILSEPFELQPRALARTQSLRESLKRRGWQELAN
ncbi:MAG: hypothetical protein ABW318_24445 [Vicinamibacterales bacterium]